MTNNKSPEQVTGPIGRFGEHPSNTAELIRWAKLAVRANRGMSTLPADIYVAADLPVPTNATDEHQYDVPEQYEPDHEATGTD